MTQKNIKYYRLFSLFSFLYFVIIPLSYSGQHRLLNNETLNYDTLDVWKYGIIGDGVTDNTERMNYLCNSVPKNTIFIFSHGDYYFKNVVKVTNSNLIFIGNEARILLGEYRDVQPYSGFLVKNTQNVIFEKITFIGMNNENESGIWVENSINVTITKCNFINIGFTGIMLSNGLSSSKMGGVHNCTITHNYFRNIKVPNMNLGTAIFVFSNGSFNDIENNVIEGPGWVGICLDDASTKSVAPFFPCHNNIIKNNLIEQIQGVGILIEGSIQNDVSKNMIIECKTGILLNNVQHNNSSDSNNIQGNIILKSSENAISIIGSSYNSLSKNIIESSNNNGINLQLAVYPNLLIGSKSNIIFSNDINSSKGYGININDGQSNNNYFYFNTFSDNHRGNQSSSKINKKD